MLCTCRTGSARCWRVCEYSSSVSGEGISLVFNSRSPDSAVSFCAPFHLLTISGGLLLRTTCLVNKTISLAAEEKPYAHFYPLSTLPFVLERLPFQHTHNAFLEMYRCYLSKCISGFLLKAGINLCLLSLPLCLVGFFTNVGREKK